jgi:hypothetical protein
LPSPCVAVGDHPWRVAYCTRGAPSCSICSAAHCLLADASYSILVEIDISLGQEELLALLAEVAPLRIHLTAGDEDRRFVELELPSEVLFVAGQGVRIVTCGRLRHELAGVGLPFDIRRAQVMFIPELVTGHHGQRLDFRFRIEQVDLENVPGLVESVVISKVNQALEPEALGLYWELSQALTLSVPLPERFEPLDRFLTTVRSTQLTVTHDALLLRLSAGLAISRTRTRPSDDPT